MIACTINCGPSSGWRSSRVAFVSECKPFWKQITYGLCAGVLLSMITRCHDQLHASGSVNAQDLLHPARTGRIESVTPVVAARDHRAGGSAEKICASRCRRHAVGPWHPGDHRNNTPAQSPYVICFQNGCMSDYEATPEMIANLRRASS